MAEWFQVLQITLVQLSPNNRKIKVTVQRGRRQRKMKVSEEGFVILLLIYYTPDCPLLCLRSHYRGEEASWAGGPDVSRAPADPVHHSAHHEPVELHQHQWWEYLLEWLCQWDAGQGRGVTCASGSRKRYRRNLPPPRSGHFWPACTLEKSASILKWNVHIHSHLLLADRVGCFFFALFLNRDWRWCTECRLPTLTNLRRNWELLKRSWKSIPKTGYQCRTNGLGSLESKNWSYFQAALS